MKIIVENSIKVRFGDLKEGECFRSPYTNLYHMKIREKNRSIDLESGNKYTWQDDEEVIKVNAEVRISERFVEEN